MINKKVYSKEEALQKIRHYCSYQERSHTETREKLYSFGLHKAEVEQLLSDLVENNYLNEERFAIQFAGGKFRMNKWGRKKIAYALQQKRVSTWCINNALKQIGDDDYSATLNKLAESKWADLKGEHHLSRQAKTFAYLQQKGFESDLISKAIALLKQTS